MLMVGVFFGNRYLGVDKFGIPSATRDAISAEESFICIPASSAGVFGIRSTREKFLVVDADSKAGVEIRGDAETEDDNTGIRVRMQARFKPRLKATRLRRPGRRLVRVRSRQRLGDGLTIVTSRS